ncbi:MAG: hypothetical protein M1482_13845 [Chloroflexi bacterium]|nr:hypothetical protein [Chloroflexota bacterium]
MKRIGVVLSLTLLLLTATIGIAAARYGYEDPALCVAGQWLVVDAAQNSAVQVFLPEDTAYGDQAAGGCATPGPNVPILQTVREKGRHGAMRVLVNGKFATTPTLTVSYNGVTKVVQNRGRGMLVFNFALTDRKH